MSTPKRRDLLKFLVTYDSITYTIYAATIWDAVQLLNDLILDLDASAISAHRTSRSRDVFKTL